MVNLNMVFATQIVLGCIIGFPVAAQIVLKMNGFQSYNKKAVAAVLVAMMVVVAYGCYHYVPDFWHATLLLVKVTVVLALVFGSLLGLYVGTLTECQYRRRRRREKNK